MRAGAEGEYAERPIPTATALRWIPLGQMSAVDPLHPIFIARSALAAVQEKAKAPAELSASFGFLVGDVYVAAETHLPYVVVDSAIHSGWSMAGDDLKSALLEGRSIAEEHVKGAGRRLVGWYQTHARPDARLSVAEVEAHVACFDQPWPIALAIAGRDGLAGGVFRVASKSARWDQYLPFYELLESDSLQLGRRKVTAMVWQNYCAPRLASPPPDARTSGPARSPRVLLWDEALDEEDLAAEALHRARLRRRSSYRRLGLVTMGGLGLVGAAALFSAFGASASGLPEEVAGSTPPGLVTAEDVRRLGDTVSFAVSAFDLRARLFAGHKMGCADLSRGLIDVEERWTAYSTTRRRAFVLPDGAEQRLRDDVAAVERRFASATCPRP